MKKINEIDSPVDRIKKGKFFVEKERAERVEPIPPLCESCNGYGDECMCEKD
jgi:hypothetical protein